MSNDDTNSQRAYILKSIKLLNKIKLYYRGIQQQRAAFYKIVESLRKTYRHSPNLFSKPDIKMIKYLVEYVNNYNNKLEFNKEKVFNRTAHDLTKGTVILHKTDYYVGVIVDSYNKTKKEADKNQNIEKEYKIFISEKEVRFASSINLIVLGSSMIYHCSNCNGLISIFSKRCKKCHWRICPYCSFCKCNYTTTSKPKKKQAIRKITGIMISQCVNCQKFGCESCPGSSETTSSYRRRAVFCPSYSPRHKIP
ncbi:MAG TPA: hypothetical protein DCK76_09495 [Desulfotomaculum sp.]|nr:hypothetical protein [Desulfotomaculum sp.]HBY04189.1 hypothetical protein [Desulfotomaculum sp.]